VLGQLAEVFLAREGHENPVGINFLEKVQMPHLSSIYGAMLAGVGLRDHGGGNSAAHSGRARRLRGRPAGRVQAGGCRRIAGAICGAGHHDAAQSGRLRRRSGADAGAAQVSGHCFSNTLAATMLLPSQRAASTAW